MSSVTVFDKSNISVPTTAALTTTTTFLPNVTTDPLTTLLTTTTSVAPPTTTTANVITTTYNTTTVIGQTTTAAAATNQSDGECLHILYDQVNGSGVRVWDILFLVPNTIFFLFILHRFNHVRHRIQSGIGSGGSPIFVAYFLLIGSASVLGFVRCIVSIVLDVVLKDDPTQMSGDANKVLWVILRFFLLTTELSVLMFGIAFGHLDSKTSIKRVLCVTTIISMAYAVLQCTLELKDVGTFVHKWNVYGHGGYQFSMISSLILLMVYTFVVSLPFVKWLQNYFSVPTKKSFYVYVALLMILYFLDALGSALVWAGNVNGVCLIDVYSLVYFALFGPLLYWTFLSSYFGNTQPNNILFSYNTQVDDDIANDVNDFDINGDVDSTLSGILELRHDDDDVRPLEDIVDFASPSSNKYQNSMESTHSFFTDINR